MSVESPPTPEIVAPDARIVSKGYLPPAVRDVAVPAFHYDPDYSVYLNRFPQGDIENFSVARAAMAKAKSGGHLSDKIWRDQAPWEKAYIEAAQEVALKANLGDQVSGIDGGYLAPEVWSDQFFGLLRSFSALDQLPINRVKVPARIVHLPKLTNDVTISYPGENTAITASSYQFGQLSYRAFKATAAITLSNELIRDASALADEVLRQEGAAAIALDRDTQALIGAGQGKPMGLVNNPDVNVYYSASTTGTINTTPAAASPSYTNVGQLIQKVETLNGSASVAAGQAKCTGVVAHSQFKQTVLASPNFQDANRRPLWLNGLNEEGGLFGMTWALSNVIPITATVAASSACSYLIAGWWQRYVLFECLQLGFDSTTDGNVFASDQTQVKLVHRWDGGPSNPESFAVLAGVQV